MTDLTITITSPELGLVIFILTVSIVGALLVVAKRMDRREANKALEHYDREGA